VTGNPSIEICRWDLKLGVRRFGQRYGVTRVLSPTVREDARLLACYCRAGIAHVNEFPAVPDFVIDLRLSAICLNH
jgi:hypothetical protein